MPPNAPSHKRSSFVRKNLVQLLAMKIPLVVGVISGRQMLHGFPPQYRHGLCDIAELRVDLVGLDCDWRHAGEEIERAGIPALITARLEIEGGKYKEDNRVRLDLLKSAIDSLSAVDVELQSAHAREAAEYAMERGKVAIVSFHDFKKTPPPEELNKIVESAGAFGSVVKISCMANSSEDIATLESLISRDRGKPLCVIAMGPLASQSRIDFAVKGSALTYGYLDGSAAPGQLPASQLVKALREQCPAYDAFQKEKAA